MRAYVGTSGWSYGWNRGKSLGWYVSESGLNAVELNGSFYRVPQPERVAAWARDGSSMSWAVKVHRMVTHRHFLNEEGLASYGRFLEALKPLDALVSYYLFQFPPRFSTEYLDRVRALIAGFSSGRMALEFRHRSWYTFDYETLDFDGAVVTPDSPDVHGILFAKNRKAYIRFHGRRSWYDYEYSEEELGQVASALRERSPATVHAFFNNDHDMLKNARMFRTLLGGG